MNHELKTPVKKLQLSGVNSFNSRENLLDNPAKLVHKRTNIGISILK